MQKKCNDFLTCAPLGASWHRSDRGSSRHEVQTPRDIRSFGPHRGPPIVAGSEATRGNLAPSGAAVDRRGGNGPQRSRATMGPHHDAHTHTAFVRRDLRDDFAVAAAPRRHYSLECEALKPLSVHTGSDPGIHSRKLCSIQHSDSIRQDARIVRRTLDVMRSPSASLFLCGEAVPNNDPGVVH